LKNKEIIIYKNGKKYKHFKKSETKNLQQNEMYILEYLLNKYMDYEVDIDSQQSENNEVYDEEINDNESSHSNMKSKRSNVSNEEVEMSRKESIVSKKMITQKSKKSNTVIMYGDVVEIKDLKGKKKNTKTKGSALAEKKSKINRIEYDNYSEENSKNYESYTNLEKNENIPNYITQIESYTSPTIKSISERKAEDSVLNGIETSVFEEGKEKKGILFLGKNSTLCFIPFNGNEDEININLDTIKKIYFNISGSANIKNYEKLPNEKFIQIINKNDQVTDIKFNYEEEYEYFIKGLSVAFRNKTPGNDKNVIYQSIKNRIKYDKNSDDDSKKNKLKNNGQKNEDNYNNIKETEYVKESKSKNKNNENEDDDIIITTKITEVFKNGELINKQTREKMNGVDKSLHVYSPDMDEYELFLKTTKLGRNQLIKRMKDGLPLKVKHKEEEIQEEDLKQKNEEENQMNIDYNEEQ
jgi:hypothetical protein